MAQYKTGASFRELPPDAPCPRLCIVQKSTPTQEYGFNLHADRTKGQFIGTVDHGSPASVAGLRPNDRIFAVNGTSIVGNSHKDVVARIKADPLKCELLVTSEEDFEWYAEHQVPIDMNLPNIIRVCKEFYDKPFMPCLGYTEKSSRYTVYARSSDLPSASSKFTSDSNPTSSIDSGSFASYQGSTTSSMRSSQESDILSTKKRQSPKTVPAEGVTMSAPPARLSRLQKNFPTDEFGFNLHAEKGKGHMIGAVDTGGIADHAGLVMGQRIVGVNNTLIYPNTAHTEVVGLIKRNPLMTELLVVSEELDRWYAENNRAFSFENAIRFNPVPEEDEAVPFSLPNKGILPSNGKSSLQVMETRTVVEHQYIEPVPEEDLVESEDVVRITSTTPAIDPAQGLEQVSTVSTTQTLKVTDVAPTFVADLTNNTSVDTSITNKPAIVVNNDDAHAATDDFIDQVFASVTLPRVHVDIQNNQVTEVSKELTQIPIESAVVSDNASETNSNSCVLREPSPSPKLPTSPVPTIVPPVTNRKPSPSFSNSITNSAPRYSPISTSTKHSSTENGFDIFKLSAKDARRALQRPKLDPRKQNLSIEEKHKMVANL